jgi:hypothetical protein
MNVGSGNDARFVPFDSPFVLRFSKDERRLRTGFGYVLRLKSSRLRAETLPCRRQALRRAGT